VTGHRRVLAVALPGKESTSTPASARRARPCARFAMGGDRDEPALDIVWDPAYEGIRVLYPAFEDFYVRHYDLQFTDTV